MSERVLSGERSPEINSHKARKIGSAVLEIPPYAVVMTEQEYLESTDGWQPYTSEDTEGPLYIFNWTEAALCREVGVEPFFPEKGDHANEAKRVCTSCPVRVECLREAVESDVEGIWGGFNDRDRHIIKRQRVGKNKI